MAQEERYGTRGQEYSAWHRRKSTERLVGRDSAQQLAMIDLDGCPYIEYSDLTKRPLALIETARDVGQIDKPSTVTRLLAKLAGIEAYCVLYRLSEVPNPADPQYKDIERFRVQKIHPYEAEWRVMTPKEWANELLAMRRRGVHRVIETLNEPH